MPKTKQVVLMLAVMAGMFLVSCGGGHANAPGQINKTLSVDDFEKKIQEGNARVIDVRTSGEYESGHLKGALNYDVSSDGFEQELSHVDKSKPVMVYCLSGGRSARAADIMSGMGFKEVYNMEGGVIRWNAEGKALEIGDAAVEKTGMTMEGFEQQVRSEKYVLVDFNAKWCKPCVKILPVLEALAERKKDKMILLRVDADDNPDLMKEKGISEIPYLELYKDGKRIWQHSGTIEEAELLKETNL